MNKIDFVITWVDDSDPKWMADKNNYKKDKDKTSSANVRFRDWELLKYWFRAIEENANWFNKIYFVTYGHLPEWLNTENERLVVVNHKDFIPLKFLPTFNSCAIEVNFGNIKNLSEKFVYFNDDMYINKPVRKQDFFENGKPKDSLIFTPIHASEEASSCINYNCMKIINKHFKFEDLDKRGIFTLKNRKYLYKNITLSAYGFNVGFRFHHCPTSFLKSTFKKVMEREPKVLENVSSHKFRDTSDVSQWLFQYWQLAENNYVSRNVNFGKYYNIKDDIKKIKDDILNCKHSMICLNDNETIDNFDNLKKELIMTFEMRYPQKSNFEK